MALGRIGNGLLNTLTREVEAGQYPTFRQWFVGAARTYPQRLSAEWQGMKKMKDFSKWTNQDKMNLALFAGNFAGFFVLGEIVGRGNLAGYPVNKNHYAAH